MANTGYTTALFILAASTTSMPAQGLPCDLCQYPAEVVVIDYTDAGKGLATESLVPLCGAHKRPPVFYHSNGTTQDLEDALDDVRRRLGQGVANDEGDE